MGIWNPVTSRSAEGANPGVRVEVLLPSAGSKMLDAMVVVKVRMPEAAGPNAPCTMRSWVLCGLRSPSVQVMVVAVDITQAGSSVVTGVNSMGTVMVTTGAVAVEGPPL